MVIQQFWNFKEYRVPIFVAASHQTKEYRVPLHWHDSRVRSDSESSYLLASRGLFKDDSYSVGPGAKKKKKDLKKCKQPHKNINKKTSDGEASVLDIWDVWSSLSQSLLEGSLWPGVSVPVRALSLGQIDKFKKDLVQKKNKWVNKSKTKQKKKHNKTKQTKKNSRNNSTKI